MSEVQPRPTATRGRGSIRAGRGGLSSRGGFRSVPRPTNEETFTAEPSVSLEEQGELGQLKKQYSNQLDTLKELFPDWTDDDLVFALQETDGDLPSTIERISEGNVSRFADVKKKTKEKKAKDAFAGTESQTASTRVRGGRGGFEGGRGGRGRGTERGRGGSRGGRGGAATAPGVGRSTAAPAVTSDTTTWGASVDTSAMPGAWDQPSAATVTEGALEGQWESIVTPESTPAIASEGLKSSLIPQGATKSWASMLAQAKLAQPTPKPTQIAAAAPEPEIQAEAPQSEAPVANIPEATRDPTTTDEVPPPDESFIDDDPTTSGAAYDGESIAAAELAPAADKLTEDNVERLPDASVPAPTETAASTVDASSVVGLSTPYGSSQQVPTLGRPPMGGYATSAWKATGAPGRSSSFQRMMEQREAVVMPGNHAVDRAAVQFGQMGLNGDSKPLDVDEDREDAETRAQPPQQSPPSQPKTSLPPSQQPSGIGSDSGFAPESLPTPRQAPGLPPPSMSQTPSSQPPPSMPPGISQPHTQGHYGQYSRYGAGGLGQETSGSTQKPYDPFSQQLNYPQDHADNQGASQTQSHASGQIQSQVQSQHGALGQGQSDYGHDQYGNEQQRNAFQGYYGSSYGQQPSTVQQENAPPQRTTSGLGASEPSYGTAQSAQGQSRFGENAAAEHNPSAANLGSQQQTGLASQQSQQMHQQQQGQHGQGGGYPYGNPYYGGGSYYGSYMNQYPNYQYNQQGYGGPYGGKGGMYGQVHHGYGASPQTSYEHSATPAASATSTSLQGRESGYGAGFSEYGRSASTQAQGQQQHTSNYGAFPGEHQEGFGRSPSTIANQYNQQQNESSLKPFQEQKSGASPNTGPPGRTGSAANSGGYGGTQSNFPPPQSQGGFGGYPSQMNQLHGNHGSQYGGFGGLGGAHQGNSQSHQGGGYGNYGAGGFGGNNYGSYGGRGGWGGNYGH